MHLNETNSQTNEGTPNKAILVTGSSSGIGHAIATYLAKKNFTVFATVRKKSDVDKLSTLGLSKLIPTYPLDLSHFDHIKGIQDFVKEKLTELRINGLYAIINTAGGGSITPIELLDLEEFHAELQTRILGPVALLQSFLPLIRKAQGRILWIATPALLPSPYLTDIHACDFAVNFISRTLKIELLPWNIPSILIRCGGIKTDAPIRTYRKLDANIKKWPKEIYGLYADSLRKVREEFEEFDKKRTDPEKVAKVVHKALISKNPKRRYRVGYMSGLAAFLELFPQTIVDSILEKKWSK
ncbi:MAG: SDR family NAD(P)-dependent oxidoreductase [Calditrichaeota bacterium]|nr:SDR family NAD(P)-dependent oxidoreductase [Calditrichota bacterium]